MWAGVNGVTGVELLLSVKFHCGCFSENHQGRYQVGGGGGEVLEPNYKAARI